MLRIVQGDESAIGFVPEAGVAVGVKQLDLFAIAVDLNIFFMRL